jgi:hypothetical protein
MPEVRSLLYDADGNEVTDEAVAVRGEVIEIHDDGTLHEIERWTVDLGPGATLGTYHPRESS